MKQSKVCVMLSTYNGVKYLDEQLASLFAQVDVDLHVLIRDDGSSDGTVQKLREYSKTYPDQISIIEGENVGVIRSFFELMRLTQPVYEFYALCDQDDVWLPHKLSRAVEKLQSRPSDIPLMYCSSTQMVDQDLKHLNIWPHLPPKPLSMYNALVENCCVGCTMVMNLVTFEQVIAKLPSELTNILMHDRWIYLFVSTFGEVIFDEEPTILYRQHQGNVLGGSHEGWVLRWKKRYARIMDVGNVYLSKQARLFIESYLTDLSSHQLKDIQNFLDHLEHHGWRRIKYAYTMPFYRQSSVDNYVLKILYVLKKL